MSITGQLILSDRGAIIPDSDRHAIMVFGVIGAPKEIAQRYASEKGWVQRLVTGADVMEEFLNLSVERDPLQVLEGHYTSHRIDQLMTSPIWRV
jgi:hypothetical protein